MSTYVRPAPMTAQQFRAWRLRMKLTQPQVAELFGRSVSTILDWERGETRGKAGRPTEIPGEVGFACAAIWHGLPSWAASEPADIIPPKAARPKPPAAGRGRGFSPQADDD